jgi:lambda repressor-like predicted transcriptional regulator
MHPEDIKAAIRKRGFTLTEIAVSLGDRSASGPTKGAVSRVVQGIVKSRRIASAISQAAGLPVSTLWPGKYPDLEKFERVAKTNPAFHREVLKGAADLARGKAVVPTTTKRRAA